MFSSASVARVLDFSPNVKVMVFDFIVSFGVIPAVSSPVISCSPHAVSIKAADKAIMNLFIVMLFL
jgi:hypothetical protein